jgi:hypothetical protein
MTAIAMDQPTAHAASLPLGVSARRPRMGADDGRERLVFGDSLEPAGERLDGHESAAEQGQDHQQQGQVAGGVRSLCGEPERDRQPGECEADEHDEPSQREPIQSCGRWPWCGSDRTIRRYWGNRASLNKGRVPGAGVRLVGILLSSSSTSGRVSVSWGLGEGRGAGLSRSSKTAWVRWLGVVDRGSFPRPPSFSPWRRRRGRWRGRGLEERQIERDLL